MALFQMWNLNRFENPLSIARNDLLLLSRLGSTHTYYKCLDELHQWGYIQYLPSKNPLKGSIVNMSIFDTSRAQAVTISCGKNDTSHAQAVHPSINNINNTNNKTKRERKKTRTHHSKKINQSIFSKDESKALSSVSKKGKRKKVAPKKEKDIPLCLPFSSEKFTDAWNILLEMPKWKGKQSQSLQLALKKLSRYDEEFSTHLVEMAITKNWQGVVFPDTDTKYEQWKQNKSENGNKTTNGRSANAEIIAHETPLSLRNYKERF